MCFLLGLLTSPQSPSPRKPFLIPWGLCHLCLHQTEVLRGSGLGVGTWEEVGPRLSSSWNQHMDGQLIGWAQTVGMYFGPSEG